MVWTRASPVLPTRAFSSDVHVQPALSNVVAIRHMWLLNIGNVASATKELNFYFA